jgi:histone-lysine N-methyltransferase SETMAR
MLEQYGENCMAVKVLLHHSNTRPHSEAATTEAIRQLKCELLPHTPYIPQLAASDYRMLKQQK